MTEPDVDFDGILERYRRDGFVVLPALIPDQLLQEIRRALPALLAEDGPQRFFEQDGSTVRAVYGLHRKDAPWRTVSEETLLPRAARTLLGGDMYVYQWKINPKAANTGDRWEWHRDFTFWQREDGMPAPDALTAAVFLDEVTEENGPLQLIPGSHAVATRYETAEEQRADSASRADDNWSAIVSANLSHSIPPAVAEELAEEHGVHRATGPAGTVVLFSSNIVHGSSPNRSGQPRTLALISYNTVGNAPAEWANPRPEFFLNHDATALDVRS
ncbi:phytanoyl-CoA dioxygenase family protein [Kitasatospora sp. NPDC059827]|uniref:phytanoyl-CoA dioxygenase family protein n=1 Tax=Kitasatospora sp. NPDC059827 TaxID=3346964 RepID=UPI00366570A6